MTENNTLPALSALEKENYEILGFGRMHGTNQLFVKIRFDIPSMASSIVQLIPMKDIRNQKMDEYLPEGFVLKNIRFKDQSDYLCMKINDALNSFHEFTTLIPQGFSCIDNKWMYSYKNLVLPNRENKYTPACTEKIDVKSFYVNKPDEWAKWIRLFVKKGPAALLISALTPFLRPVTEPLGFASLSVNSFLVGPTGCGKTSWAKLLTTDLQGRTIGVNLGSDAGAFFKEISKYRDCSAIVDDLATSDSDSELEERMRKFSELMQMNSTGGIIRAKGSDFDMERVSLFFTGEYLPSAASKLNRCLIIRMDGTEFPADDLSYLQKHQNLYRSFLAAFIRWICTDADEIRTMVASVDKQGFFTYKGSHAAVSEYYGFARVMSSCRLMLLSALLLVRFLCSKNVYNKGKDYVKFYEQLTKSVEKAVSNTLESVRKVSETNRVQDALIEVFASDPHRVVATGIDGYVKRESSIFFVHNKRIYVKNESLRDYLNDKFQCDVSSKSLSQELEKSHLFYGYGKDRSGDIPKTYLRGYKHPKCKGRHYALRKSAICDLVLSKYERWLLGESPLECLRPKAYK